MEESKYLKRLRRDYKLLQERALPNTTTIRTTQYNTLRQFCLDTNLISFNDLEVMEHEVDSLF